MADANKSSASSSWLPVLLICCWAVCLMSANGSAAHQHHVSAAAAAPAPAPAEPAAADCSSDLLNLADCLTFVVEGSKEVKPQGQCCPGLKKVLKGDVSCLCQAFGTDYGIKLNMTKALTLPAACGVNTPSPPLSNCNNIAVGAPGAAPGLPPAAAPSATTSNGESVARVPAPSPLQSAAASGSAQSSFVLLAVAIALFANHH